MQRARLPRPAVHGHAGRRRHAGHPDSAVGAAGGVRHPDRAEHRQAVRRGDGAGPDRDVRLPDRHRHHLPRCARNWRSPASRCPGASAGRRCSASGRSSPIFVVVFGGIYGGIFSPTEGAAVGAVGTFVAGLAQRELDLQGIRRSFLGTAETSAMVFMIFLGADMMNSALALTQMPAALADWVGHLHGGAAGHRRLRAAVLRAARLRDGRAVDAAADHSGDLPGRHGPATCGPGARARRSGSASWC